MENIRAAYVDKVVESFCDYLLVHVVVELVFDPVLI